MPLNVSGEVKVAGDRIQLGGMDVFESLLFLKCHQQDLHGRSTNIELGLYSGDQLLDTYKVNFLAHRNSVDE